MSDEPKKLELLTEKIIWERSGRLLRNAQADALGLPREPDQDERPRIRLPDDWAVERPGEA